ncbi:MAG: PAS domain-containing protein [Bacillota bacterium]
MEYLNKDEAKIKRLDAFMDELLKAEERQEKRQVYETYKDTVQDIRPIDLFHVNLYGAHSKASVATIKKNANKFVNAFKEGLERYEVKNHDHPFFDALLSENDAITTHLKAMKEYFKGDSDAIKANKAMILKGFEKLMLLERKYQKKENILFPRLEEKLPSTNPLTVMWALHDDARVLLKKILSILRETPLDVKTFKSMIGDFYYLVYGIMQKEQLILFPVAIKVLSEQTMDAMYEESFDYGFTFIERTPPKLEKKDRDTFEDGLYKSNTGTLSFKQLTLIFSHLPLDLTYVDKDDRVQYFNNKSDRHFPRSPSIIGRLVKHCHPPKSVGTVEKIVTAFKEGTKDTADFWIDFKGTFLYIRYFAIRDEAGNYEGVLEVSQDVTAIRNLEGEKRLLDWD